MNFKKVCAKIGVVGPANSFHRLFADFYAPKLLKVTFSENTRFAVVSSDFGVYTAKYLLAKGVDRRKITVYTSDTAYKNDGLDTCVTLVRGNQLEAIRELRDNCSEMICAMPDMESVAPQLTALGIELPNELLALQLVPQQQHVASAPLRNLIEAAPPTSPQRGVEAAQIGWVQDIAHPDPITPANVASEAEVVFLPSLESVFERPTGNAEKEQTGNTPIASVPLNSNKRALEPAEPEEEIASQSEKERNDDDDEEDEEDDDSDAIEDDEVPDDEFVPEKTPKKRHIVEKAAKITDKKQSLKQVARMRGKATASRSEAFFTVNTTKYDVLEHEYVTFAEMPERKNENDFECPEDDLNTSILHMSQDTEDLQNWPRTNWFHDLFTSVTIACNNGTPQKCENLCLLMEMAYCNRVTYRAGDREDRRCNLCEVHNNGSFGEATAHFPLYDDLQKKCKKHKWKFESETIDGAKHNFVRLRFGSECCEMAACAIYFASQVGAMRRYLFKRLHEPNTAFDHTKNFKYNLCFVYRVMEAKNALLRLVAAIGKRRLHGNTKITIGLNTPPVFTNWCF